MSSGIEHVTDFVNIIDKWKVEHQNEGYDPLPFLTRCSEILQSALIDFLVENPDPCGKRDPKHVLSESKFGKLVKVLEDCREFNDTMTSTYLKTNASPKNIGRVAITSARLAVLAVTGYRITGLDTEEYVNVLMSWIIYANEPLRTYATGLINGCCVVKKSSNDNSIKLINTLLKRLWNYLEPEKYEESECIVFKEDQNVSNPRKRKHSPDVTSEINSEFVVREDDMTDKICVNDWNNNSCVNQMPAMLGVNCWLQKPLTSGMCQCYAFHLLKCFGELQEFQSTFYECKVLPLISRYLKMKSKGSIVYKALEFLSTLFCHTKAATDFIELNGIQKLIDIPRPSMASTGVAMCLHNLACRKEAMEKICLSSANILRELMNYASWLLECSHELGKSHIAMFFCETFSNQNVLSLFDDMNGLRYLVNMICTTKFIIRAADDEYYVWDDPDLPYTTSQTIKSACVALMKYFEAHVVFKVGQLVKSCPVLKRKYPSIELVTKYESATHTRNQHFEYLNILRESADECDNFNPESWAPIALFQRLDGISLLLKIINDTHELKVTVPAQAALYVLCVVTLSHSCQIMLTKCYPTLGLGIVGLYIILDFIENITNMRNITYEDGISLNCAVAVIANCTEGACAKSSRDGNESMKVHDPPRYNTKKRDVDTLCKVIWQADGIKTLICLLDVTKPAQTADETRYLACKALAGLAKYQPVRQILPKLHVLTSKILPVVQEPILKDKKDLHVKFYNNLKLLLDRIVKIKVITPDIDLKTALRNDVVTGTRERYDNEDVLLMIYIRLLSSDFDDNPPQLTQEAEIVPDGDSSLFATPKSVRKFKIGKGFVTENSKFCGSNHSAHPVTFNSITQERFWNQHSKCGNRVVTVAPFSLSTHQHCPKPRNKIEASVNFLTRHCYRQGVYPKCGDIGGVEHDLRMIYSRFRPVGVIRPTDDRESHFTAVAFDHNSDCKVILGDCFGNFHFHKASKFEDGVKIEVFDSDITYIEPSKAGNVMLTQLSYNSCALLAMNDTLDVKLNFESIDFIEFSKTVQDKIVASFDAQAIIFDANTGTTISTYGKDVDNWTDSEYKQFCYYEMNRATFSYDDRLVLSSGCLWDVRKPQTLPVHKFVKFNDGISGVFHPNDLEVIINTEVWDMRTFNLIQTMPPLDQCQLSFNRSRSVMYAMKIRTKERPGLISSVHTFNSSNYNQLGFIPLKQQVLAIALDDCDRNIAMIETPDAEDWDVFECRMYEVGGMRDDDGEK